MAGLGSWRVSMRQPCLSMGMEVVSKLIILREEGIKDAFLF